MKKLNKFTKKAAELEAWASVLEFATEQRDWNMKAKTDENGEYFLDENGDR